MAEGKSDPFALFDQLTAARAAMEETGFKSDGSGVGVDRHQTQRMEERREAAKAKGQRLAAKPRQRSRPVTAKIIRGHHENPGA